MPKNKKSDMSIALIVTAVIALIILVVIIAILSGKLGSFSRGAEEANTCDSLCKSAGYTGHSATAADTPGIKDDKGAQCKCT